MRKGKRLLGSLLVLSLLMTMMMGTTVFAQENENVQTEEVAVETEIASVSSTVVGPDGNVYTYLGTATRSGAYNYPVDVLLSRTVTASEGFKLAFYCPNNNGRDLIKKGV